MTASIHDRSSYRLSAFLFDYLLYILSWQHISTPTPRLMGFFISHDNRFLVRPVPPLEEELNREVYSETCSSAHEQRNNINNHTTRADLGVNLWCPIGPFAVGFRGVFHSPI